MRDNDVAEYEWLEEARREFAQAEWAGHVKLFWFSMWILGIIGFFLWLTNI